MTTDIQVQNTSLPSTVGVSIDFDDIYHLHVIIERNQRPSESMVKSLACCIHVGTISAVLFYYWTSTEYSLKLNKQLLIYEK